MNAGGPGALGLPPKALQGEERAEGRRAARSRGRLTLPTAPCCSHRVWLSPKAPTTRPQRSGSAEPTGVPVGHSPSVPAAETWEVWMCQAPKSPAPRPRQQGGFRARSCHGSCSALSGRARRAARQPMHHHMPRFTHSEWIHTAKCLPEGQSIHCGMNGTIDRARIADQI